MQLNPLFVRAEGNTPAMEVLKRELRLSGVPDNTDANALIAQAVGEVRIAFYRRLGSSRIAKLASGSLSGNPTSDKDYKKWLASLTEIRWVKLKLLEKLPVLFEDSSGSENEAWNTEGTFRKDSLESLEKLRVQLASEVEEALQVLAEDKDLSDTSRWSVESIGPDDTPPRIGDSIKP